MYLGSLLTKAFTPSTVKETVTVSFIVSSYLTHWCLAKLFKSFWSKQYLVKNAFIWRANRVLAPRLKRKTCLLKNVFMRIKFWKISFTSQNVLVALSKSLYFDRIVSLEFRYSAIVEFSGPRPLILTCSLSDKTVSWTDFSKTGRSNNVTTHTSF